MHPDPNVEPAAPRPEASAATPAAGRRAGLMPMVVGGLIVAFGLLAFLFYEGDTSGPETTATTPPSVSTPAAPATGAPAPITTPTRP